jgi:hypothetical protein
MQGLLAAAEDAARASRQREDAARAQGREFADRARRAETLCEEAESELAQVWEEAGWGREPLAPRLPRGLAGTPERAAAGPCAPLAALLMRAPRPQVRAQLEASQAALSEAKAARAGAAAQLAAKDAAVDALTTLSLRGDAAVQEYMSNVKVGLWRGARRVEAATAAQRPRSCMLSPRGGGDNRGGLHAGVWAHGQTHLAPGSCPLPPHLFAVAGRRPAGYAAEARRRRGAAAAAGGRPAGGGGRGEGPARCPLRRDRLLQNPFLLTCPPRPCSHSFGYLILPHPAAAFCPTLVLGARAAKSSPQC